jgi:hypothetical protein
MSFVKPAALEQSAMTTGDSAVVRCCTQPGMALFRASMVGSLQLVGMSLSIYGDAPQRLTKKIKESYDDQEAQLTIILTLGFAARIALSMIVYEPMMLSTFRWPMLTSLVPSMN